MKRNLHTTCSEFLNRVKKGSKVLAAAGLLAIGASSQANAQWVIYNANVLPAEFSPAFVTSNVNPAGAATTEEFSIVADPDNAGNNLLRMAVVSPRTSFLWRQNLAPAPDAPTAGTVVIKAKGIGTIGTTEVTRAFEVDLDFNGTRETFILFTNGTIRLARSNQNTTEAVLTPLEWNTYRFTKAANGAVRVYVNESNEPLITTTTSPASTNTANNYFRFGDGDSGHNYASYIDFIAWDFSGATSPQANPLPVTTSTSLAKSATGVSVYPNPATDRFSVSHPVASKGATIEVYSVNGSKVASFVAEQGSNTTNLSVASLKQGMYIVSYTDATQKVTSRFVKQ